MSASSALSYDHFVETPKQRKFAEAVFSGKYRYLFYGGAIRGGKSYCVMAVIFTLCWLFPGSRWAIVRKDLPTLRRNILPVFNKLKPAFCGEMNQSTWEAKCTNGSRIILFPESYKDDKSYNRWRGLEVNGLWLEEANELQQTSWNWSLQRAGSWVIPPSRLNPTPHQPTPYIFLTSNPAANWVKRLFYTPWKQKQLKAPYFYIPATVHDNPYLSKDYLDSLELLPERDYKVFVLGDWDELAGAALEELNEKIHIVPPLRIPDHWMRFGAFDWGFAHPFSFGLYAVAPSIIYKVETITGRGMADAQMISYIKEVAREADYPAEALEYVVAGPDAFSDIKARVATGETTAERFIKAGIPMIPADPSRIAGLKNFRELTAWQKKGRDRDGKPIPGEPGFKLFDTKGNRRAFEQFQNMLLDPDRPEDVLKVDAVEGEGGDDTYDETRYGLQSRAESKPEPETEFSDDQHPGFDVKKRERKRRTQVVPEPGGEDDLRGGIYRVPRHSGFSPHRMPRFFGPQNFGTEDTDPDSDDGSL